MTLRSGATVTSFATDRIEPDFQRAELRFEGLTPPVGSFEVRVFGGEPNAGPSTPTEGNPHYLGSQWFYGVGGAPPAAAPAADDPFDLQLQHKFEPTEVRLNVTRGLRNYLASGKGGDMPVTLVVVDRNGNELADSGLDFEGLSLVTT